MCIGVAFNILHVSVCLSNDFNVLFILHRAIGTTALSKHPHRLENLACTTQITVIMEQSGIQPPHYESTAESNKQPRLSLFPLKLYHFRHVNM